MKEKRVVNAYGFWLFDLNPKKLGGFFAGILPLGGHFRCEIHGVSCSDRVCGLFQFQLQLSLISDTRLPHLYE